MFKAPTCKAFAQLLMHYSLLPWAWLILAWFSALHVVPQASSGMILSPEPGVSTLAPQKLSTPEYAKTGHYNFWLFILYHLNSVFFFLISLFTVLNEHYNLSTVSQKTTFFYFFKKKTGGEYPGKLRELCYSKAWNPIRCSCM